MTKDKSTGAATAPQVTEETPKKRERLSFSKDKKLAFLVLNLVSILKSKAVATVLTEEQKTKIAAADKTATEIGGGDPVKPTVDRIKAIQDELGKIDYKKDPQAAVAQALELGKELDRQIKRKAQIEELIGV